MDFVPCATVGDENGLASLRKLIIATLDGEANFLLDAIFRRERSDDRKCVCGSQARRVPVGCPHLVVLFDSIAGLCFHKTDHFLSLFNPVSYTHLTLPTSDLV